jgi:hypothetical protein
VIGEDLRAYAEKYFGPSRVNTVEDSVVVNSMEFCRYVLRDIGILHETPTKVSRACKQCGQEWVTYSYDRSVRCGQCRRK